MLMAEAVSSPQINGLLIQIGKSLLQYVSESWPWAGSGAEETRRTVIRLADEQRANAAALARLLDARGEVIDFGTYPTGYTSLHYVAVDFLLAQLVENQREIARVCETVFRSALSQTEPGDADAADLLREITAAERRHLDELERLSRGS